MQVSEQVGLVYPGLDALDYRESGFAGSVQGRHFPAVGRRDRRVEAAVPAPGYTLREILNRNRS